ncbi:MAG TPA: DUF4142 domain-containing protein [Terriglobia bacterium]|nr:DUF4142 domain-containing protein [Terriglobia bacterium]
MKRHLHSFIFGLIVCMAVFGLAACQRGNDNVQAAREPEPATNPAPSSTPAESAPVATANTLTGADRDFVKQAEKDNLQERVLGRMAQEQSQNNDVKSYGKMLVKDHNDALQQLVDLMNKNGMPQPKTLPEERTDAIKKMEGLKGAAFDKEFVNMMVEDHQKAIDLFQKEANTAQNSDVRDYAKDVLPTLQKHLKDAKNLLSKIKTT